MESKQAYIFWLHPEHKHKKIPVGMRYCPHIVRLDDPNQAHWSISFFITQNNQQDEGIIEFTMLVNNEQTTAYFNGLTKQTNFILCEGMTAVAKGYIL